MRFSLPYGQDRTTGGKSQLLASWLLFLLCSFHLVQAHLEAGNCGLLEASLIWPVGHLSSTLFFGTVVLSVWSTDQNDSKTYLVFSFLLSKCTGEFFRGYMLQVDIALTANGMYVFLPFLNPLKK